MRKRQAKDELLESADAGRILNVSAGFVRQLAQRGRLRAAVITPRGVRLFRRVDVERLAAQRAAAENAA